MADPTPVVSSQLRRELRQILKTGGSIKGYYAIIQALGPSFRRQLGRWARRRGRTFEERITLAVQEAFRDQGYPCIAYRSANERCATQLYDIVLYIRHRAPMFLECKTGGAQQNSRGLRIDCQHRALKNWPQRKALLTRVGQELAPVYYFCFAGVECEYLVPLTRMMTIDKSTTITQYHRIDAPADWIRAYHDQHPSA